MHDVLIEFPPVRLAMENLMNRSMFYKA
jgi:hypothetical protein